LQQYQSSSQAHSIKMRISFSLSLALRNIDNILRIARMFNKAEVSIVMAEEIPQAESA
jgi:hypothetical protein